MSELFELIQPLLPLILIAIAVLGGRSDKKRGRDRPLPRTEPRPRWGPGSQPDDENEARPDVSEVPGAPQRPWSPFEDWLEKTREDREAREARRHAEEEDPEPVGRPMRSESPRGRSAPEEPVQVRYATSAPKSAKQSRQELADLLDDEEMRDPAANILGAHVRAGTARSGFGKTVTDGKAAREFIEHVERQHHSPWARAVLMRTLLEPAPGLSEDVPCPSGRRD